MTTLHDLFIAELSDMHDAERRQVEAFPKIAEAATFRDLRDALVAHREESAAQLKKINAIYTLLREQPNGRKCHAINGILRQLDEIISESKGAPTINAALIAACQKIEHYEIASYGCLREWAQELGQAKALVIIDEILDQEKNANRKLNDLAKTGCNKAADDEQAAGEAEMAPPITREPPPSTRSAAH